MRAGDRERAPIRPLSRARQIGLAAMRGRPARAVPDKARAGTGARSDVSGRSARRSARQTSQPRRAEKRRTPATRGGLRRLPFKHVCGDTRAPARQTTIRPVRLKASSSEARRRAWRDGRRIEKAQIRRRCPPRQAQTRNKTPRAADYAVGRQVSAQVTPFDVLQAPEAARVQSPAHRQQFKGAAP